MGSKTRGRYCRYHVGGEIHVHVGRKGQIQRVSLKGDGAVFYSCRGLKKECRRSSLRRPVETVVIPSQKAQLGEGGV